MMNVMEINGVLKDMEWFRRNKRRREQFCPLLPPKRSLGEEDS